MDEDEIAVYLVLLNVDSVASSDEEPPQKTRTKEATSQSGHAVDVMPSEMRPPFVRIVENESRTRPKLIQSSSGVTAAGPYVTYCGALQFAL